MNDQVGNALAAQGVSLYTVYGMTEVGLVNTFARRELAYAACDYMSANSTL